MSPLQALIMPLAITKEQGVHAGVKQSCQCLGLAKPELGFPVQLLIQRVGGDLQRSCHVLLLQTAFPDHCSNVIHCDFLLMSVPGGKGSLF